MREGKTIRFGERDLIVPPFNLRTVRAITPHLYIVQGALTELGPEHIDAMAAVIAAGIGANYPEINTDVVLDTVEFAKLKPLLDEVLAASGMMRAEAAASGEAKDVASTGTSSTST